MTPLFDAVVSGDAARVRARLASGADPNAREDGDNATPLHVAAANGQLDVVRALLDGGRQFSVRDPNGFELVFRSA